MFKFRSKKKPVSPLVSPDIGQLTPLDIYQTPAALCGLMYTGGFQIFSQSGGVSPFFDQSYTPDNLGLLQGQFIGQPLIYGGNN